MLALEAADDATDGVGVAGGAAVRLRAEPRDWHAAEPARSKAVKSATLEAARSSS